MQEFNKYNVPFSTITWFMKALSGHKNISRVEREDDIIFCVELYNGEEYRILLLNEYVLGVETLIRAQDDFNNFDFVVNGGDWNRCTGEVRSYGKENKIGVFMPREFFGALHNNGLGKKLRQPGRKRDLSAIRKRFSR